jgi:hypothetical protein
MLSKSDIKKKKNSSVSLTQGNKFDNYQNKIKNNLEKKNKLFTSEGFSNMDGLNLSKNGLTRQTNRSIDNNAISNQEQQILNNLIQEYQNSVADYENLISEMSGSTNNYFNRVNPNNPYLDKTVSFTTGQLAYVTSQGVLKYISSKEIQESVNIPTTITPLNIPWSNSYSTPGVAIPTKPPLVSGTPIQLGQTLGNEGTNVYVSEILSSNISPSYMGCYASNPNNNNMTFIGGTPPPANSGTIKNGNFSQPQISSDSFEYITSDSKVPSWNFNAVLVNNSSAWGYPTPYPNGSQCLCIQATQYVSQTVYFEAGIQYTLTFVACGRNCCDGSGLSNPINVQLYTTNNQLVSTIFNFQPPVSQWTNYSTTFTVGTSANFQLYFSGTWTEGDRSTAIQNIQLTTSNISGGTYTYSECEQAAINSGYQYFALQNVNPSTSTGYCAVSNSQPAITQYGNSTIPSKMITLWESSTNNSGSIATLTNVGSLSVLNSNSQSIFSTPGTNAQPSNYLGCYGDSSNRAMSSYNNGSQQYNLQQCQQIAQQQNSTYFGLQNSTSGTNAQCFLSNDFSQTTKYGKASNCTQISDGSYSGGGWSNAVYNTSNPNSNYFLILQDDGNMVIYRGINPNDNQGGIWASGTNGQLQQANPQYAASNGKYGKNWISSGQTLAAGDWVGSKTGNMVLIMQPNGNLVLYTFTMMNNCQKMNDGNIGGGIGANAAYNIGVTAIPGNAGKLAYIDANSEAHLYPSTNQMYSNNYTTINDIDTPGNDLPNAMITNATVESCTTACNNNKDCAGFIFDKSNNNCWPKTSSMYPYGGSVNSNLNLNLYIRKMVPKSPPIGVSQNTNSTDTVTYNNYVDGGTISNEYGLFKITSVQREQLKQKQQKINLLANQITELNNKFGTGINVLQNQSEKNVTGLNDYLTDLTDTNKNIINTTEKNNGNLQNILKDSDIVVLQKNYTYLAWSILAAGTVLITMNIIKK